MPKEKELNIDAIGALVSAVHDLLFSMGDLNQKGECPFCGEKIIGDGHCERKDCVVGGAISALKEANAWEDD